MVEVVGPVKVGRWRVRFLVEPRDLWVGLFWDRRMDGFHLYVCPFPMLVLHGVRPRW